MIVGVLTTCHTQYTWGRSICIFLFLSIGLRQGSGLYSSSSRKYPGTEGTNRNRHETITADMLQTVWNELDIVLIFSESQSVHI
jgi:hypothetical protein